jgi:hypothetical protein
MEWSECGLNSKSADDTMIHKGGRDGIGQKIKKINREQAITGGEAGTRRRMFQ